MKHHRYKWPMAPLATSVARRRSLNPKPKCLHLQQSPENWKQKTDKDKGHKRDRRRQMETEEDKETRDSGWRSLETIHGQADKPDGHLGLALNHVLRDLTLEFNTGGVEPQPESELQRQSHRAKAKAILGQSTAILRNAPLLVLVLFLFALLCSSLVFLLPGSLLCVVFVFSTPFFRASLAGKERPAEAFAWSVAINFASSHKSALESLICIAS